MKSREWIRTARPLYALIDNGAELSADYARQKVRHCLELGCNTLGLMPLVSDAVTYRSSVAPQVPTKDGCDFWEVLISECRTADLNIYAVFLHCYWHEKVLTEHPDWSTTGAKEGLLCMNTPARQYFLTLIAEFVERYDVDGIQLDVLPGSCSQEHCLRDFKDVYGREFPLGKRVNVFTDPEVIKFRRNKKIEFMREVRRILDEKRPGAAYFQFLHLEPGGEADIFSESPDMVAPQINLHYEKSFDNIALYTELAGAYSRRKVWGQYLYHGHIQSFSVNPPVQTQLSLAEEVRLGANPFTAELSDAWRFAKHGAAAVAKTNRDMGRLLPALSDARPLPYAALFHSRLSEQYNNTHLNGEMYNFMLDDKTYKGYYRVMAEQHIPHAILSERDIQEGGLSRHRVLVIPEDQVVISDRTIEAVEEFVASGGGLVLCHLAGERDERGEVRRVNPLHRLAGFKFSKTQFRGAGPEQLYESWRDFNYCSSAAAHPVTAGWGDTFPIFHGSYAVGEYEPDCRAVAHVHEVDPELYRYSKGVPLRGEAANIRPGKVTWPLASLREKGGRVVYISAQVGAEWRRPNAPEFEALIGNAIRWAGGGELPYMFESFSPTVRCGVFFNRTLQACVAVLTNLTTNPFLTGVEYLDGRISHLAYGVVKYVVPVSDVRIRIRSPERNRAAGEIIQDEGTSGVECSWKDGWVNISVEKLGLYAGLLVPVKEVI